MLIYMLLVFLILILLFFCLTFYGLMGIHIHKRVNKSDIKIACVGDSITYGCFINNWFKNNYPKQLSKLLGNKYCVRNYGVSGCTAMYKSNKPYKNKISFYKSLHFKPDVLFIMFGTNDSKTFNWKSANNFKQDLSNLISKYQNVNPHMKVYILTPACAYEKSEKIGYNVQKDNIVEIVDTIKTVCAENRYTLINVNEFTSNHNEWFEYDGIHSNKIGCKNIADLVFSSYKNS